MAYGGVSTKDGHICIAGVDEKRWPAFCKIMGIEHLQNDPEYSDNVTRNFHGDKIQGVLDAIFPKKTSKEWLAELNDADILATEVVDYHNMLKSEQARMNGYLLELGSSGRREVLISGQPVTINGEVPSQARDAARARSAYRGDSSGGRLLVGGHRETCRKTARSKLRGMASTFLSSRMRTS